MAPFLCTTIACLPVLLLHVPLLRVDLYTPRHETAGILLGKQLAACDCNLPRHMFI